MPLLVPVNQQVTKSIKARILQMLPDPGLTPIFALSAIQKRALVDWAKVAVVSSEVPLLAYVGLSTFSSSAKSIAKVPSEGSRT